MMMARPSPSPQHSTRLAWGLVWVLAWRNLWRNRRRTALTASALGLGVAAMGFSLDIMDGLFERIVRVATESLSGHAQIHAGDYRTSHDEATFLAEPGDLLAALRRTPAIEGVAPRVVGTGLLAIGDRSRGVRVLGIEPEQEVRVTAWQSRLVAGHLPRSARDVLIGAKLARKLEVDVDAKLVLMVADIHSGEANSEALRVCGIVHTGNPILDESIAIISLDLSQQMLGVGEGVHEIALRLNVPDADRLAIESVMRPFQKEGLEIVPWHEINRAAAGGLELQESLSWIFVLVVFVVISFGIVNTISMSLLERWREFGILRALGTSPVKLSGLILAESAMLGMLGALPGAGAGMLLSWWLSHTGIPLGRTSAYGVTFVDPLYPRVDHLQSLAVAAVFAALTVLVASVSAWRAGRVEPVEAMRRAAAV